MGTNSATTDALERITSNPHISGFWGGASTLERVGIIIAFAFLIHLFVKIVRHLSEWSIKRAHREKHPFGFVMQQPKVITVMRLIISTITFLIYAVAILVVLMIAFPQQGGEIFTTYLTSATVIGLAVSFGLQGLVQDVVTGVTLIFSNAMDVGDVVEVSGIIGRVEQIGLRYTKLQNFYNQTVFVPNRIITNVARFPHGGIHAYADIEMPKEADAEKISKIVEGIATGMQAEFAGIILAAPEIEKIISSQRIGWNFLRVQFKIWPGQGALIETTFRQKIVNAMKTFDAEYKDQLVTVTYRAIKFE